MLCYVTGSEIWLYVVEALLLIVTGGLSYATKNVPGELNEAQSNIQGDACTNI